MLRIGKLTDYALLIISQMAREPHAILSAASLAERLHLTSPTVSKILKILSEAGIVSSVRGADGGYHLARLASDITVADIIIAMEGDLAMTACCETQDQCLLTSCTMRENWQKINNMVHSLLASFTMLDMLTPLSAQVFEVTHDK
ncbi:MAG: SUF system Fe-S cluster assembly regulator [Gammaproteobacteria bacterium]|nr:SUF system Fe-S cluster assembly regulator [Gammaproteobacteria bacterium]